MKTVTKDIFLKLMFNIRKLYELHNNLLFMPERIKIEKVEKLDANLHDEKYFIHIKDLKQALILLKKPG